jgi:hypothetical protein
MATSMPPESTEAAGVLGFSGPFLVEALPATGVYGIAAQGGGRACPFSGPAAQIRLEPASTTHPASGAMGDLFADTSGRLWFRKGDTVWKQVA